MEAYMSSVFPGHSTVNWVNWFRQSVAQQWRTGSNDHRYSAPMPTP